MVPSDDTTTVKVTTSLESMNRYADIQRQKLSNELTGHWRVSLLGEAVSIMQAVKNYTIEKLLYAFSS